jgi:hypothetical protein
MSIWKTKPLSVLLNEASEDEKGKELYLQDLWFALGVGAIMELVVLVNWYCCRKRRSSSHVIIYISSRGCICRIILLNLHQ